MTIIHILVFTHSATVLHEYIYILLFVYIRVFRSFSMAADALPSFLDTSLAHRSVCPPLRGTAEAPNARGTAEQISEAPVPLR